MNFCHYAQIRNPLRLAFYFHRYPRYSSSESDFLQFQNRRWAPELRQRMLELLCRELLSLKVLLLLLPDENGTFALDGFLELLARNSTGCDSTFLHPVLMLLFN